MRANKLFYSGLIIVELIAGIFRFWQLNNFPVSLTMDEVAIGYGSYSLFKTGRDEWGKFMPLAFYSVSDYKPPVNYYLLVPTVGIFGPSEWSARIPVALLGCLTVLVFVIFLRRLGFSRHTSLAGGLWLAILPWHVYYSRFGIEAVTGLFFLLLGFTWFLQAIKTKKLSQLIWTIIFFGLSIWSYHTNRLFVPLLVVFLFINRFQQLKWIWKKFINICLLFLTALIVLGPFIFLLISSPAILQRGAMTSILREQSLQKALHYATFIIKQDRILNPDLYIVWHHWVGKYLNYFDFLFLFGNGLGLTSPGYADSGLVYFWDMFIVAAGVYALLRSHRPWLKQLVLFWILTGQLTASLAMNEQHSLRAMVWLPVWGIIWVSGIDYLLRILKSPHKYLFFFVYILLIFINIIYVKDLYTVQMPKFTSEYWGYGYEQAAVYACQNQDRYDRPVIGSIYGSQGPLFTGIPDYYVLFFCRYDPHKYIAEHKIDKFDFGKIDWHREQGMHLNTLLISAKWDFPLITPPQNHILEIINYLNDLPAFYYVTTNEVHTP